MAQWCHLWTHDGGAIGCDARVDAAEKADFTAAFTYQAGVLVDGPPPEGGEVCPSPAEEEEEGEDEEAFAIRMAASTFAGAALAMLTV